jgi:propionyl-CoA carboxylase alpha chain
MCTIGEIAVRVMRTCRRLNIPTVAVYSDADVDSLHVRMADEAVRIGPPVTAESYLNIDKVVNACLITGATHVHPGYGFLSENAEFARQLERNGVIFIGPTPDSIMSIGDKVCTAAHTHTHTHSLSLCVWVLIV